MTFWATQTKLASSYWRTLYQLGFGKDVVQRNLDIPLALAAPRAFTWTAWSVVILCAACFTVSPNFLAKALSLGHIAWPVILWLTVAVDLMVTAIAIPIAYGFLRLYTLIHHVMVLNVFRNRGQRLRLLNFQSTLLPLSVVAAVAWCLYQWNPLVGYGMFALVAGYVLYSTSHAYNMIFHKTGLHGLLLWFAANVVTWFVLFIGALAIVVAFAVVSFFGLVLLRVFVHHTASG